MAGRILNLISTAEEVDTFKRDESTPASSWGIFKAALGGKDKYGKGKLFKIMTLSLLAAVAAILGIYFFLVMQSEITLKGAESMASSNFGWGGQFSIGTGKAFNLAVLDYKFMFYVLLIPSLLIFGAVLSGLFYIAKRWAYMEHSVGLVKTYVRGFLKNAINFLVIFLLLGGVLFLFNFALKAITTAQINSGNNFGLVFAIICLCIFLGFYLIMTMYMCTLSVTYKMNIFIVIKNAALLTIGSLGLVLRNIIITAVCFAPAALFWIPGIGIVGIMFFALFGIMISIVGFTVYSQWVFRKVGLSNSVVSYAGADTINASKKAEVVESTVKAESVEPAEEEAFSPTTNAQTNAKKSNQNSKKKKRKH